MVLSSVFEDIKIIGESEDPEWIAAKLQQMKDPNVEIDVVADSHIKRSHLLQKLLWELSNYWLNAMKMLLYRSYTWD
jgi:hypothetical protein